MGLGVFIIIQIKSKKEEESKTQHWRCSTIEYILSNERYIGDSLWQKTYQTQTLPRKPKKNKGEMIQYFLEQTHPAIIDRETFQKAQRLRASRVISKNSSEDPIRQKLVCGVCGSPYRIISNQGMDSYECQAKNRGTAKCETPRLSKTQIHKAFLSLYYRIKHYGVGILTQLISDLHNSNYPADAGAQSGKMADQTFSAANASRNLNANQFRCKGYTFDGWTTGEGDFYSDGAAFTQTVENEGKVILYAQWEKLADVTIFYTPEPTSLGTVELNPTESNELDPQDGMVSESLNPETGEVQGATAVPGEGSVFVGWYDAQDTERSHPLTGGSTTYTPERDSSGRYQDGSYVALFRLKQYVLHYEANGGTGKMDDQIFPHGQAYPLKKCAFSREGYRFVGWATKPEGGEVKYEDQKPIKLDNEFPNLQDDNDEVTLYAVWQEQSVTLSYESNDTELGTVTPGSETIGAVNGTSAGSIAQPKNGARFDGWYSADGTLLSTDLKFVPTREAGAVWQGTTYYAHFSAKRSPSTPSTPAKPDETKPTLAPIPEMLNGEDHYAYLLGYEDGTVRPNGSISRAEVATVLFRLLKDDVRMQNLTKDNAYSDVSDTAWYSAAVSTLSKMGVISGYPDGTFRPNAPITRAEFAAMIARFDETAKSADTPFTDISGHWAENAIGKAYGNGWVEGSSKTVFCPESNLTRAETATFLNRVLHRLPEKESDLLANQIVWPDNPETFWGYLAIQEATNSHEYERKADGVHETQTAKRENRDWSKEFEQ